MFIVIPELSLSFRRLHDIDKSACWLLSAFVPVIGALGFLTETGTVGTNNYGDDLKVTYRK